MPKQAETYSTSDLFRWLEENTSDTNAWLTGQAERLNHSLAHAPHRAEVLHRVTQFLAHASADGPIEAGGQYFYSRREPSGNQASLYRRDADGRDHLLVSPPTEDRFSSVTLICASPDGAAVAYGTRSGGRDDVRIRIIEVATGKIRGELPEFRTSHAMLSPDLKGYFYVRFKEEGCYVCRYDFGPPPVDVVLLGPVEVPDAYCVGAQGSPDMTLALIRLCPNGLRGVAEYCIIDRRTGGITPCFRFEHKLYGQFLGEELFVLTDWNAPRKRILAVHASNPLPEGWREVIPEGTRPIQQFSIIAGMLFVNYKDGLSSEIRMYTPQGHLEKILDVPLNGSASAPAGTITSENIFYEFSSLTCPHAIFKFHIPSHTQEVWHQSTVPFEFRAVRTEQAWYTSRDGTRVPMSLTYRKDIVPSPETPVMLTAYGGFGVSESPRFTRRSALWVEMGGIFAKANIRGGGEFGEEWHRAAMRDKRQNAFDDFISAAEWMIVNGYTTPSRLAIVGGSNSGLLMGAALVQRPELFAAVVCFGPILDLLRYHLFPGGEIGLSEYGCADNPDEFDYLLRLSPYHNVVNGVHYPAVLFISGDADTRCHPMHARKMCARLQEATASERPILLDYHEQRGHAGFLPLDVRIETLTRQFCFLLTQLRLRIGANGRLEPIRPSEAANSS